MVVDFTLEFWLALAWSIVALSLVAITLLLVMIRRGRATEVTSLMYLTPPATAVLAWLMFDEMLGACRLGRRAGHDGGSGFGTDDRRA